MRVWGRTTDANGVKTLVEVSTDANGDNSAVYITWLAQVLKLNLGESPFWADWGIPQYQTIMTQVYPDYYSMRIQQQFATLFSALTIIRVPQTFPPVYNVNAVTKAGYVYPLIQVPT